MAKRRITVVALLFGTVVVRAADPVEFYKSKVRPVLAKHCYACHTDSKMAGLRLDSRESIVKGGQSGPAVSPGKPDESLLILAVTHKHERLKMPPQGKLSDAEIEDLRKWIEAGAHFDSSAPAISADPSWPAEKREHWAFQPVRKPAPPRVKNGAWARGPIDEFVLARLEQKGLQPARPADKRTLLKRVTFDMVGLPPTAEEMQQFLADESPQAFEKVLDRLLNSPRYGERWGRHWLDVARYADEDALGLTADPFVNGYRYRDWVIQAINEDMPYDRFVKAQIAGDLLESESENRLRPGLGLFGLGPWYYKIVEPPKAMADEMQDRIDVLTRGFLGLTVACARCHDHKYDPVSNKDYYALAGIFFNTRYTEHPLAEAGVVKAYNDADNRIKSLEEDLTKLLESERRSLAERLAAETRTYLIAAWEAKSEPQTTVAQRHNLDQETLERWVRYLRLPEREHPYLRWWDELDANAPTTVVREAIDRFQTFVDSLVQEQKDVQEQNERIIELHKKSTDPYDLFCKGCNAETKSLSRDKYVFWSELFEPKGKTNGEDKAEGVLSYSEEKIERFLSEAKKAQAANLRAQVKAQQDALPKRYPFLHTISDTKVMHDMRLHVRGDPYNLGPEVPRRWLEILGGAPLQNRRELAQMIASPENPLTARVFVNRVWHHHFGSGLVRTLSNFGLVGERPSHPQLLDYLATRFVENGWSVKKLHREIVLSATYAMSSALSKEAFAIDPENRLLWRQNPRRLEVEALRDSMLAVAGNLDLKVGGPAEEWTQENHRRSVYGKISRFRLERLLTLFDFPDPAITSEKRAMTSTPVQRLFFLNSDFVKDQARTLVDRLEREAGEDQGSRLQRVFQILFGRDPNKAELAAARSFLQDEARWPDFAQVLLSSNEFCFVY